MNGALRTRGLNAPFARAPLAPWAAEYVGIPFAAKGYDRAGCNCWGLVCLVYRERLGIALPRHEEAYGEGLVAGEAKLRELRQLAGIVDARKGDWREIEQAKVFDAVLLPIGDALCHVALYVGDLHLLHVEEGSATCCEDLRLGRLDARLRRARFYRYLGGGEFGS